MKIFKKSHLLSISLTILLLLSAGCDNFLNVNSNPNEASSVKGDLLFPTVIANFAEVRSIELGPGNTFIAQIWSSNGSSGVFTEPERYTISTFTTGNTWNLAYVTAQKNLKLIIEDAKSAEPKRNNVAAQCKILKSYAFYMLTSVFGPVPYNQALDADKYPNPEFDDQETILQGLVTDLTDAVDQIDTQKGAEPGVTDGDLIYGGNMEQWIKFGNSLKLRILMLIRNKDTTVDSQITDLLTKPLIRTNEDEADFPFYTKANNENNLWKLNNQFAGFVAAANGNGFIFANSTLVDLMKSKNDPRLSTYFEYATDLDADSKNANYNQPTADEYFGADPGTFNYNDKKTSMVSQNTIRKDWPSRIISASEVLFYEAEFLASNGSKVKAEQSFKEGVNAALDYFDGKPGAISPSDKASYVNSLPDLTSLSNSKAVKAVNEQEYIEVYDKAPENWMHWKRTKVPELTLPSKAELGDIIRRFPYPPDERASNQNIPDRIPLVTPMWFEK